MKRARLVLQPMLRHKTDLANVSILYRRRCNLPDLEARTYETEEKAREGMAGRVCQRLLIRWPSWRHAGGLIRI